MSDYRPAAVCRRGHTIAFDVGSRSELAPRCTECGAVVLTQCEGCGYRIRGNLHAPGVIGIFDYEPPDFCDHCGEAHPWAGRQARVYELENLLDEEELGEAERLLAREQLEALRSPDLSEEEQAERWARIKKYAPGLLDTGRRIAESLMTAAIKAQLGL